MAVNAWLSVQSERCPGATQLMEKLIFKVGRWRMLVLMTVKLLCGNVYGVHSLPRPCVIQSSKQSCTRNTVTFMMQMKRSRFSKGVQYCHTALSRDAGPTARSFPSEESHSFTTTSSHSWRETGNPSASPTPSPLPSLFCSSEAQWDMFMLLRADIF